MSTLVLQSPTRPTAVLAALESLAAASTRELRLAVAYATSGGCLELIPRLIDRIGRTRWHSIAKTAIVTTDFHMTEPRAVAYMRSEGISVRFSRLPSSNYHPKLYAFASERRVHMLVGSANLTLSALSDNVEAVSVSRNSQRRDFDLIWEELVNASVEVTDRSLERYEQQRKRRPPKVRPDARPNRTAVIPASKLTTFQEALDSGLRPARFGAMWVDAGKPSGGAKNQLEPPRGIPSFFGLSSGGAHLIGRPVLISGGREWKDCDLTWHGQGKMNRMVRFNLPTLQQGGFSYVGATVLFLREGSRYQLLVAQAGDPIIDAWKRASRAVGHEYQLGKGSPRRCGLF
jgi:HKD family nuclease